VETKICSKCKNELPVDNFCKDRSKKDGLFIWCRACRHDFTESRKEQTKIRNEKNKEHIGEIKKEYAKNYATENIDKVKITSKKYRSEHKQEIFLKKKEWRQSPEGKECYRRAQQKYAEANHDKIKESRKKYKANKLATDPIFKFKEYFGNIFRYSLKKNKISKHNKPTFSMLGYSLDELKIHIESQFEPWMNWTNQGSYNKHTWDDNDLATWTWQVDHIIPNSTFLYSSTEDESFKQCWALDNLRPLSAKQNWLDGICKSRHKTKILKYTIDNIWKYESGNYWEKGVSSEQDNSFPYERWSKRIIFNEDDASFDDRITVYRTTLLSGGTYPNWAIHMPTLGDMGVIYNSIYKDKYRVASDVEDAKKHIDRFLGKLNGLKSFL